jgi:glycerol-3-phosphate dehydrogenase (NAD(P)+)
MLAENGHSVAFWARSTINEEIFRQKINGILSDKACEVDFSKFLRNCEFTNNINICGDCGMILVAVPSMAVCEIAKKIAPIMRNEQIIVNLAKGFENETLLTFSQVLRREIPNCRIVALTGPTHAEEVLLNLPSACVAASSDLKTAKRVQDIFMSENFRVYTSNDIIGVEIAGALKNIIAICCGILSGMGLGDNTRAAIMTRGLAEISRLGVKMGAAPETFFGLSGVGDLIVTCTSMHSRNFRAGRLIALGETPEIAQTRVGMVVEGVAACRAAMKLSEKFQIDMPITREIYKILFEQKPPRDALKTLMCRQKRRENDC